MIYLFSVAAGLVGGFVVKIKKAKQEETEGMPVDLNNVQP